MSVGVEAELLAPDFWLLPVYLASGCPCPCVFPGLLS